MKNIIIVQKCFLYDKKERKILILQRSDYKPESAYLWDAFGGSLEEGEECIGALKREGEEEIKVEIRDSFPVSFKIISKGEGNSKHTVIFSLNICDDFTFLNQKPSLSNEHITSKWITLDEWDNYNFMNAIKLCKNDLKLFIERFYPLNLHN